MLIIEDPGGISGSVLGFRYGKGGEKKKKEKKKRKKGTRNRVGLKTKPKADPEHATIPVQQMMQFENRGSEKRKCDVMPNSGLDTDAREKKQIAAIAIDRKKKNHGKTDQVGIT